jgi:hypothetical protein
LGAAAFFRDRTNVSSDCSGVPTHMPRRNLIVDVDALRLM